MKKLMLIFAIMACMAICCKQAGAEEIKCIEARLDNVLILPEQGELTKSCEVILNAGINTLQIPISEFDADLNSVRVKAFGEALPVLNGISFSTIETGKVNEDEIENIRQKIQKLRDAKDAVVDDLSIAGYRQSLITSLRKRSEELYKRRLEKGDIDFVEQEERLLFYSSEYEKVCLKIQELSKKRSDFDRQISELDKEYRKVANGARTRERVLLVELESQTGGQSRIEIVYMVDGCRWLPYYDMNYNSKNKTLEVHYYAAVSQRTGGNWKDVKIGVSTTRFSGILAPKRLEAWEVSFNTGFGSRLYATAKADGGKLRAAEKAVVGNAKPVAPGGNRIDTVSAVMEKTGFNVSFALPEGITMLSGSQNMVLLSSFALDARLSNIIIPCLGSKIYILAEAPNCTGLPLLAGRVKCFVDGALSTEATVGRVDNNQLIRLPISMENRIKVQRILVGPNVDDKKNSKVVEYHINLEITSCMTEKMNLLVVDRLPITKSEDIKISKGEFSVEPTRLLPNGILEWEISLEPKGSICIETKFNIEFPKDFNIDITGGGEDWDMYKRYLR